MSETELKPTDVPSVEGTPKVDETKTSVESETQTTGLEKGGGNPEAAVNDSKQTPKVANGEESSKVLPKPEQAITQGDAATAAVDKGTPKKPAKKAIITGITGQDGSYLAEFLLEKVCLLMYVPSIPVTCLFLLCWAHILSQEVVPTVVHGQRCCKYLRPPGPEIFRSLEGTRS